ncbi:non-homologous end joining protein Ku [Alicyclobacillus shizuokensis]|uniref:non-homologous end joining protein Ku n=1 Tax=Alicyclobacillus shizuokensis TaxID=392014 RepID=UPI001FDF2EBF|nr:Ku protein [Alicyclobacillus shizuokensis]
MWKGAVSFGLVNVPVRMFAATESKDIKFRYLHRECKTPIQYTRTCPHCDRPVEWDEIVRGYEYEPNKFVIFDDDDWKQVEKSRSHTIDIVDFVNLADIDPVYYDKTYYLAPEAAGVKAYQLLQRAMRETGKVAVAKTVLRNSETLACVRVYGRVLVVETLFWPAEVRGTQELPNIDTQPAVSDQELNMAITLVNQLAGPFEPAKYTDERRQTLLGMIEKKLRNQEVAIAPAAEEAETNIVDLMQALQESIRRSANKPDAAATTALTEGVKPKRGRRKRSS